MRYNYQEIGNLDGEFEVVIPENAFEERLIRSVLEEKFSGWRNVDTTIGSHNGDGSWPVYFTPKEEESTFSFSNMLAQGPRLVGVAYIANGHDLPEAIVDIEKQDDYIGYTNTVNTTVVLPFWMED